MNHCRWSLPLLFIYAVLTVAGCSHPIQNTFNQASSSLAYGDEPTAAGMPLAAPAEAAKALGGGTTRATGNAAAGVVTSNIKQAAAMGRKIIYNSELSLVVQNLTTAQQQLAGLVTRYGGYISHTQVGGTPGQPRQGTWTVRIPVDGYDQFMVGAARLGELQSMSSNAEDVTEQYYDVEARLKNKQVEEQQLIGLLKNRTAKLRDILEVEREISRVRGEVEQLQGQLRLLKNQTGLATVSITLQEVQEFLAPRPTTFTARIARAWHDSLVSVRDALQTMVISLVSSVPWLVFWGVVIGVILVLFRRWTSRRPPAPKA